VAQPPQQRIEIQDLTSSSKKSRVKKTLCDYCGEEGHGLKDCPHDESNERRKRSRYGQYDGEGDEDDGGGVSDGSDL
jgi:hypothetical protein